MSETLKSHVFDPLIAVTKRSSRVVCGTIPIIFDKTKSEDVRRAQECYKQLVRIGIANGWPPYRIGIDYKDEIKCDPDSATTLTHKLLKVALDSNNVISPGRYDHSKTH